MNKNRMLVCLAGAASFLVLCILQASPALSPSEMMIPFELKGYLILVKCRVNDSQAAYDFIVDTGGRTFIDKTLADELQLKQRGPMAKINRLAMGSTSFENVFVLTQFDFSQFKRSCGLTIQGMIGSDFLDDYTVTIDYRKQRLILSSGKESFAEQNQKSGKGYFIKFAKHPINNSPMIKCKLNGEIEVQAMIDTGQPFPLVLPLGFLETTGALNQKETLRAKGVIVKWPYTKGEDNYLSRIRSLEAGSLTVRNIATFYAELPAMLSVPLLGKDFLSRFWVQINYPKCEILLLPEAGQKDEENVFSTGLAVKMDADNNVVVRGIWEKSPADRAGIEVGNRILEFNSKKLTPESFPQFSLLLQDERVKTIEVLAQNNDIRRKVVLKKEYLLK